MRIGLVIYGRLDTLSGGYLYDRQLVAHLRSHGDEVDVLSLPWQGYGRHLLHNLSAELPRRLRAARYDLLLQDELNHPSLFWLNRRLRGQLPLVSIVHHLRSQEARPAWQNGLYRLIERAYLHTIDGFVCNSQTTWQTVAALAPPRPACVAPPAGDRFQPLVTAADVAQRARQAGPLRLVFVGNLIPRKRLHLLLAGLAPLPRAAWRLAVVGNTAVSPAYTRRVRTLIRRHGLAANVALHGPLPDAGLAALLADSHLLAVPSSYEGFGIVYLEGMGFGLPALAGAGGAAHELVQQGQTGFLVSSAAHITHHVRQLHADRAYLARLGHAAQRRFAAHPTWQDSMARIRQFLHGMAG